MAKKKKREIAKRRLKRLETIKKKRKKGSGKSRLGPDSHIFYRPGLSDMGAPEGFRSISMAQALMEYAKPLMEYMRDEEDSMNDVLQVSMMLWNYSLALKREGENKKIEKEILEALKNTCNLDKTKAQSLFTKMIERQSYLFPEEMQPESRGLFMFIRKEERHHIKPFDYNQLVLSDTIIPPDQKDRDFINMIKRLDSYVQDEAEYEMYEDLLISLKDDCPGLFEKWLIAKGFKGDASEFSFCPNIYFDFIYGYMHEDIVFLNAVPDVYLAEFFEDFLLRKVMAEPNEYVNWPPALKLLYQFLYEKEYLDNYKNIIKKIDRLEPSFIEVLKKQFS
jgi:hypothetical protein